MKQGIAVWLCTMGVIAGCGGAEPESDSSQTSTLTGEQVPPALCRSAYVTTYYGDAAHTIWWGRETCVCGSPPSLEKKTSPFAVTIFQAPCNDSPD
ncbi:hypothetical protein LZ198_01510 [Myxococcus sp. K15C18031901]|uniref:hypothetical protein n=1 Tax=Myxococcus dinghuensis TaxID=2906761 RepID=UPI0020A78674|nr:hypothetical protein [Myxococcus dinghuensis]MCP3097546.1 hypothetical protein [Myxococcus dinghuensis]